MNRPPCTGWICAAHFYLSLWFVFVAFPTLASATSAPRGLDRNTLERALNILPLSFEPNEGQSALKADFIARGRGFSALFTHNGADVLLADPSGSGGLLHVTLPNASRNVFLTAEKQLPGIVNYFNGSDPQDWYTGLPTFERLRYANIYAGIDLIYYGNGGRLEFDYHVSPGSDPGAIRMRFAGAESMKLDRDGNLVLAMKGGEIRFQKPVIYQPKAGGGKDLVSGRFRISGRNTIGFAVAGYDRTRPLVIDPILNYSTYIGALAEATSIAVDQNGEAYVTGIATLDFPTTPGSYQPVGVRSSSNGYWPQGGRVFVAKFNSAGTALLYSTFLSGGGVDWASGLALDAAGDAFVVGTTSSTNFPVTPGTLQITNGAIATTGFVTEIASDGAFLVYSTYLGGNTSTSVNDVAVDASGNAYITGDTEDTNFPTTAGAYRSKAISKATPGLKSAFVVKLNPAGTTLVYSSYLGGSQTDGGWAIAVDSVGEAYVGGETTSNDFPVTAGAIQGSREGTNQQAGFVTKFNASGSATVYSTYLGGDDLDYVNAIALDSSGNAYVTGSTNSPDFPVTAGAFQTKIGTASFGYPQVNAFVSELNSTGTLLSYSTFLGGGISSGVYADEGDAASAIAVDGQGMVYLTGSACTGDFPVTAGAFESEERAGEYSGQCTAFLTVMNPALSKPLLYSTFFGGTGNQNPPADGPANAEGMTSLALDPSGNVYLAGYTSSVDFPTTAGVVGTAFDGYTEEAVVAEFTGSELKSLPVPTVTLTSTTNSVLFGQPVTFTATVRSAAGTGTPTGYVGFNFLEEELSDFGAVGSGIGFGPWTTVPLNGSGVATFTTSSLQALQTPVNAMYLGDEDNAPVVGTMTQTVTDIPTVTTVASNANDVPYNTPVIFTATVLDNTGKPAKGFVFFLLGNIVYAELNLNSAGEATWTNGTGGPPLPVGTDAVEVEFIPYTGYQESSGTIAETFTALGTAPDPAFTPPAGTYSSAQQVNLTDANSVATIYYTTDGSTPVPGTSDQFHHGIPIPIDENETIKALAVAPGYAPSDVVSAVYAIPPSFSVTGAAIFVVAGATIGNTSTIYLRPTGGFTGTINLTCAIAPTASSDPATCSIPAAVTISGSAQQTATLTVTTTPASFTALNRVSRFLWPSVGGTALGCILLAGIPVRRRRWSRFGLFVLLIFAVAGVSCGGGGGSGAGNGGGGNGGGGGGNPGTTLGQYVITVTGTSGSLTETGAVPLTVQ